MHRGARLLLAVAFTVFPGLVLTPGSRPRPAQIGNSISGHVFGESHRPLPDIYVELLNEVNSSIGRAKTDGAGRYVFGGLSRGTFTVRVLPYGTDYLEQTKEVIINPISSVPGSGGDNAILDFYLEQKPRDDAGPFAAPGVIFAQEVPGAARKFYEKGINALREKKEKEGFEDLKKALEIFPQYYVALDRLGTEYVLRGYYEAAAILLTKAVEVNPRSFSSTYGLGVAQYQLRLNDLAVQNLQRATSLYDKSAEAHLWLGLAQKRAGKLDQAEAAFKRAKEINKGRAAEAFWQLAKLYGEQKRYKEAADALEMFLKHQPDSRDAEAIRKVIKQLREKAKP